MRRILGKADGRGDFVWAGDLRHDDAGRADVEYTFDEALLHLGDAHQRRRVATARGADVLQDCLEVEMPMLGIDRHPIEAQLDGDLGDRGRFERYPQSARQLARASFSFRVLRSVGMRRVPKVVHHESEEARRRRTNF